MRPTVLWGALLLSVAATGCTVESRPYAESPPVYTEPAPVYTEPAPVYTEPTYDPEPVVFQEPPPLVSIEPNVYVVYNYPVPVYYVGGFYWRFHSGLWYRAPDYNASWVSVNAGVVPRTIAHRHHHHYVRYTPARAHIVRAPSRYRATTRSYSPPARSYRSTPTYRSTVPTYRPRPAPQRQVVRPGYVQERSAPVRRPAYKEPVQRQRVRGRDVPPPRPRVQTPPRPQQPVQPRRDDRRRVPPNRGTTTHDHPHRHSQEKTHHH